MKKIDKGLAFAHKNLNLFRCTVCMQPYDHIDGHSLVCENNHRIDMNKKGTLTFLNHAVNTEYDDAMLAARRRVLTAGLFDGIVDATLQELPAKRLTILDVGTGEGTPFSSLLGQRSMDDVGVGFDISKAGINLASQLTTEAFFAVADLARLPFNDQSFDVVLEFFSPSAYDEFNRVLKPAGQIIKIVPASGYLREIREMLYPVDHPNHTYSNTKVVERFLENYPNARRQPVTYQWTIPTELYNDLLQMTPLHWGARPEAQAAAQANPLTEVTVDVEILVVD